MPYILFFGLSHKKQNERGVGSREDLRQINNDKSARVRVISARRRAQQIPQDGGV